MAVPKTQRSKSKQRKRRGQPDYKYTGSPALGKKGNRKAPIHMVTKDTPVKKKDGKEIKFLPESKTKKLAKAS